MTEQGKVNGLEGCRCDPRGRGQVHNRKGAAQFKPLDPVAVGIRKKIVEKRLHQKTVASLAGFTEQQFSDMLNGRKIIKAYDLFRIADALGVEAADLLADCQSRI